MWIVLEENEHGSSGNAVGPFIKHEDAKAYAEVCNQEADDEDVSATYHVIGLTAETLWGCVVPQM